MLRLSRWCTIPCLTQSCKALSLSNSSIALVGVIVLESRGAAVAFRDSSLRVMDKLPVMSGKASCLSKMSFFACSSVVSGT